MGVVNRRWVWAESMGVVVRSYIDFLILLITTTLVSALFGSSIPTFFKCFSFLFRHFFGIYNNFLAQYIKPCN